MAISRKRKQQAVDEEAPSNNRTSMKHFIGVSKALERDAGTKKRKMVHARQDTPPAISITPAKPDNKRKRKLETVAEDEEEEERKPRVVKQLKQASTPRTKRVKTSLPPSPLDTPSKSALALFGKLRLNPETIPFALGDRPMGYETPPDTPEAQTIEEDSQWPVEFDDLCQLNAAFLSALSMYYAHNGSTSPANVNSLLPMITKNFKKRAVTLDDLRRVLVLQHNGQPDFVLEDGGRAGPRGRALKRAASYIEEDELNGRFEQTLQASWSKWQMSSDMEPAKFIDQLLLAEIAKNASAEKASPLFARGQQRLADIKAAQAGVSQSLEMPPPYAATEGKPSQAVQSRGTSLLDRVLARQALTSSLPAGPTKQHLERNAALHRIEDIARVLGLLVGAKPRVTLSMQAMVQQLQQSLRNPISREEVERCLELMAGEITPEFVSLFVSGSVKGVVVRREGKVDMADVRERIGRACV
ncbi:hypothetical protein LTR56_011952 [Elasticomyces elasticus]|nr:hypothetical protein LTR56_011952 [Elasticomyces elasticus]KAK3654780.1 hypothetical protein LTR22_010546 [Elasticomyces elasticus]KAK4920592.1 hypothetical protein LTR49_011839 [Elasticomyces elasticus]KAK5759380.1 hypothetical protein LTS12_010545 [Elasticomyces elasticus]